MRALHGDRSSIHRDRCRHAGAPLRLSVFAILMLVALMLSSGSAVAAEAHEYLGTFGPDGTEASSFEEGRSVAVDETAEVIYVLDRTGGGSLFKFDLDGNPVPFSGSASYIIENQITGLIIGGVTSERVSVDPVSHTIYLTSDGKVRAFQADGEPYVFTSGPDAGTSELGGFDGLEGASSVTVDRYGVIYASHTRESTELFAELRVFAPSGEELLRGPLGGYSALGLTVGSVGEIFVDLEGGIRKVVPSEVPVTSETVLGEGEPEMFIPQNGPVRISYDLTTNRVTGDLYVANREPSRIALYNDVGRFVTSFAGPGQEGESEAAVAIAVEGRSGKAFVVDGFAGGASKVKMFGPAVGVPTTESFVSKVTGDSATLGTTINPNTLGTSYHFEYGLEDCLVTACNTLPTVDIGAGYNPVAGSRQIFGLQPGTIYHYRVVAQNSKGASEARGTFTTQTSGFGFALADSRAWEMVSPPQKFGARLFIHAGGPIQAAEDGDSLVFESLVSIEEDPEGNRAPEASSVLSRRAGVDWQAKDLTIPHGEAKQVESVPDYTVFSPDLGRAIVSPKEGWPLSPEASERTPYLRTNAEPATYTPMVTAKDGVANVPSGTEFGQGPIEVVGTSRDLDLIALDSPVPLIAGAEEGALYGWSPDDRQLRPISVLPAESAEPGEPTVAGLLGSGASSVRNAVSADGSRVFWSQGSFNASTKPTALFVRDLETEESVRLDVPTDDAGGSGQAAPVFQAANADGRVAVFSDTRQLTKDASPAGQDLYRCQLPPHGEPLVCELTNLTAPTANPGESGGFVGLVPGLSEDGTSLYFVARGVLDSDPNQVGDEAAPGEPNLYLWRENGGVRYLATLSEADQASWGGEKGEDESFVHSLSAGSSPSGRYLIFTSERPLTGYDNRDAGSGSPVQEVFRYDAVADSIVCVSCNPTGARPEGELRQFRRLDMIDPAQAWEDDWIAATLPVGRKSTSDELSLSRPRAVLDNGRVFFNAVDGLVPADSNAQWDVYQYEPSGVGNCGASTSGPSTAGLEGGCVSLMSSGTGQEEAAFLDASVSGDDVFFLTGARLAVTDVDGEYDVYDARVDGVPARLETSSQCQGEACQPAAIARKGQTPGTATFQGPGDPKPKAKARKRCGKHKQRANRKGKARCHRRNGRRAGR